MILSGICVVHCLLTPVAILLLPAFATFFSSTIESVLVLSAVPLSAISFFPTWKKHRNPKLLYIYLGSLFLLVMAHLSFHYLFGDLVHTHATDIFHRHDHAHDHSHTSWAGIAEPVLMITGALGLAWATWKNNHHTHSCEVPGHRH